MAMINVQAGLCFALLASRIPEALQHVVSSRCYPVLGFLYTL